VGVIGQAVLGTLSPLVDQISRKVVPGYMAAQTQHALYGPTLQSRLIVCGEIDRVPSDTIRLDALALVAYLSYTWGSEGQNQNHGCYFHSAGWWQRQVPLKPWSGVAFSLMRSWPGM
jgi:hypothetical protein